MPVAVHLVEILAVLFFVVATAGGTLLAFIAQKILYILLALIKVNIIKPYCR